MIKFLLKLAMFTIVQSVVCYLGAYAAFKYDVDIKVALYFAFSLGFIYKSIHDLLFQRVNVS